MQDYFAVDKQTTGELLIEIVYTNEHKEYFELTSLSYNKNCELRYTVDERRKFVQLTKTLEDSVAQASSNLSTLRQNIQKQLIECELQVAASSNVNILIILDFFLLNSSTKSK